MSSTTTLGLFGLGILAGALITVQTVLNSSLGARAGVFGSILILTIISFIFLIVLIVIFPSTARFRELPGLSKWYLYLGGVLGVIIVALPIFLVPRIGAAVTLTAIVVGQLTLAMIVDHYGLLSVPKINVSFLRIVGIALVALGAYLVAR